MNYDDFLALCDARHAVRSFSEKQVDANDIEKVMKAASLAPNIENMQPWHFEVVMNKELKQQLMSCTCYGNFVEGASAFIVATCNRKAPPTTTDLIWNLKELEYSCVAAMENIMLAATSLGLQSCWVSLHHGPTHDILKLADSMVVIGGIMLGYAKEGAPDKKHVRKPLTEMYTLHN